MTPTDLIAFEDRVKDAFLAKQIHAPVHLSGGNEEQLIDIFKHIQKDDWVLSTWRNHYHALLKGIPEEWLYQEILAGHSMYIENAEHRFLSSSIVGGIIPIAVGLAMGIQRRHGPEWVWCFIGDMAARTGIYYEGRQYGMGHNLPITFVVEDNGLSTNTPTKEVWGKGILDVDGPHYAYKRIHPHVGVGEFVTFG